MTRASSCGWTALSTPHALLWLQLIFLFLHSLSSVGLVSPCHSPVCSLELKFHLLPEVQPVCHSKGQAFSLLELSPFLLRLLHLPAADPWIPSGVTGCRVGAVVTQRVTEKPEVLLRIVTLRKCLSKGVVPPLRAVSL